MGRLSKGISKIFGKKQPGDDRRSIPQGAPAPTYKRRASRTSESEIRLKDLLSQKDLISAGRLQVLGLDKIREQLAPVWENVAEKVDNVVKTTIRRRLAPIDVFMRYGDQAYPAYIILFAELTKEEAQIKCALLAEEIAEQVLGLEEAKDFVQVKTIVATVEGGLSVENVDPFDAICQVLDREAETIMAAASDPAKAATDDPADSPSAASAAPASPGDPPDRRENTWIAATAGPASPEAARESSVDIYSAAPAGQALPEVAQEDWYHAPAAADRALPRDLQFVYRPVWDVHRGAILTFRCTPSGNLPGQSVAAGYDLRQIGEGPPELLTEFDILGLDQVRRDLQRLHQKGRRLLLACCLYFETLADGYSRRHYLEICQAIPEQYRRDLVFEVLDIPEDVPQARLAHLIPRLQPFSRAVHSRVASDRTGFEQFRNVGFHALGIGVEGGSHTEAQLMQLMNPFVVGASKAGFRAYISGLGSTSLAVAAVGAGFDYIDGDAVYATVGSPAEAYRFNPTDLFSHLLRPAG